MVLKTRLNSKYQSKGSIYLLLFKLSRQLVFLTYVFWKQKTGFGKVMKNSAGCGIFVKKEGNRDQAPPLSFQTLVLVTRTQL